MNARARAALPWAYLAAALIAAPATAVAQADFPRRAVKFVVPVPPGNMLDSMPRIIGEKLSVRWNQPVIVENRPGAASNVGTEAVAKSEPDGYTLLVSPPGPLSVAQHVYPKLGFDPTAFVPVTTLVQFPFILIVNAKSPVTSFADLIANALPQIRDGKIKVLAVAGAIRIPELPDVPAIAELYPGFYSTSWFAIVAPPKTPSAIATTISQAIAAALKLPDVIERYRTLASTPVGSSPAETAEFLKQEAERWRQVIADAGIKPE